MIQQSPICPICDEGNLSPARHDVTIDSAGEKVVVRGLEFSRCDKCGAEPVMPDQIRRNQRLISDAKRSAEGLLTGGEILAIRDKLGLSQSDAAKLFGGGQHGFSKYERGQVAQSISMDRLLRVVAANPWLVDFLAYLAGTDAPRLNANDSEYSISATVDVDSSFYTSRSIDGPETLVVGGNWVLETKKAA